MAAKSKVVVLVHGLGAHRVMTWLLGKRLERYGYRVENWGYRSIRRTLESHGKNLLARLDEIDNDPTVGEIYLVTHSMGGIVARTALARHCLKKLRRMVMLCPPNRGSKWATVFGPLLRPLCGTIDQLATRPDSYVNTLPICKEVDVGIIAAAYDPLVPLHSTYLGCERDHLIWPFTLHSGVLFRAGVAEQVHHFFKHGEFMRQREIAVSA